MKIFTALLIFWSITSPSLTDDISQNDEDVFDSEDIEVHIEIEPDIKKQDVNPINLDVYERLVVFFYKDLKGNVKVHIPNADVQTKISDIIPDNSDIQVDVKSPTVKDIFKDNPYAPVFIKPYVFVKSQELVKDYASKVERILSTANFVCNVDSGIEHLENTEDSPVRIHQFVENLDSKSGEKISLDPIYEIDFENPKDSSTENTEDDLNPIETKDDEVDNRINNAIINLPDVLDPNMPTQYEKGLGSDELDKSSIQVLDSNGRPVDISLGEYERIIAELNRPSRLTFEQILDELLRGRYGKDPYSLDISNTPDDITSKIRHILPISEDKYVPSQNLQLQPQTLLNSMDPENLQKILENIKRLSLDNENQKPKTFNDILKHEHKDGNVPMISKIVILDQLDTSQSQAYDDFDILQPINEESSNQITETKPIIIRPEKDDIPSEKKESGNTLIEILQPQHKDDDIPSIPEIVIPDQLHEHSPLNQLYDDFDILQPIDEQSSNKILQSKTIIVSPIIDDIRSENQQKEPEDLNEFAARKKNKPFGNVIPLKPVPTVNSNELENLPKISKIGDENDDKLKISLQILPDSELNELPSNDNHDPKDTVLPVIPSENKPKSNKVISDENVSMWDILKPKQEKSETNSDKTLEINLPKILNPENPDDQKKQVNQYESDSIEFLKPLNESNSDININSIDQNTQFLPDATVKGKFTVLKELLIKLLKDLIIRPGKVDSLNPVTELNVIRRPDKDIMFPDSNTKEIIVDGSPDELKEIPSEDKLQRHIEDPNNEKIVTIDKDLNQNQLVENLVEKLSEDNQNTKPRNAYDIIEQVEEIKVYEPVIESLKPMESFENTPTNDLIELPGKDVNLNKIQRPENFDIDMSDKHKVLRPNENIEVVRLPDVLKKVPLENDRDYGQNQKLKPVNEIPVIVVIDDNNIPGGIPTLKPSEDSDKPRRPGEMLKDILGTNKSQDEINEMVIQEIPLGDEPKDKETRRMLEVEDLDTKSKHTTLNLKPLTPDERPFEKKTSDSQEIPVIVIIDDSDVPGGISQVKPSEDSDKPRRRGDKLIEILNTIKTHNQMDEKDIQEIPLGEEPKEKETRHTLEIMDIDIIERAEYPKHELNIEDILKPSHKTESKTDVWELPKTLKPDENDMQDDVIQQTIVAEEEVQTNRGKDNVILDKARHPHHHLDIQDILISGHETKPRPKTVDENEINKQLEIFEETILVDEKVRSNILEDNRQVKHDVGEQETRKETTVIEKDSKTRPVGNKQLTIMDVLMNRFNFKDIHEFDVWLERESKVIITTKEVDFKTIKLLIIKLLVKNGLTVREDGKIVDAIGQKIPISEFTLRPIFVGPSGSLSGTENYVKLEIPRDTSLLEAIMVTWRNKMLGTIPLGVTAPIKSNCDDAAERVERDEKQITDGSDESKVITTKVVTLNDPENSKSSVISTRKTTTYTMEPRTRRLVHRVPAKISRNHDDDDDWLSNDDNGGVVMKKKVGWASDDYYYNRIIGGQTATGSGIPISNKGR